MQFQLKAHPSVLFLVSSSLVSFLPNRQERMGIILFGNMDQGRLVCFLDDLLYQLVPAEERDREARNSPTFVVVWDNVALQHCAAVTV